MTSLNPNIPVHLIVFGAILVIWHIATFELFVAVMLVLLYFEMRFGSADGVDQ